MKDYRLTIRFTAETLRRLQAAARRRGRRESDLVRDAVEAKLLAEEDAYHIRTRQERWLDQGGERERARPQR